MGLLSWWPNKEGIEWFLKRVYPLIKKRLGDVEMVVVGDREGYVKDAAERFEGVELTGYVEKVDEYYEDCGVFVVPLRVGSGIRVKILNAMAAGMPVVSSSIGLEGIPARDGREVMVADTVDEFAEKVEKVLIDESLAMELSRNALSFIENEYSEEKARLSVEKVFE